MNKIILLVSFFFITIANAQNPGDLVTDFGVNGKVLTNLGIGVIKVYKQLIQPDGKILLVGKKANYVEDDYASGVIVIIRLNPDGTKDTSFNSNGYIINNSINILKNIRITGNGKIIVGGNTTYSQTRLRLMQYNADGTLDTSFGVSGILNPAMYYSTYDYELKDFNLQSDGKIILLGITDFTRYNANGTIDYTFGTFGAGYITVPYVQDTKSITILPDDKFVVSGTCRTNAQTYDESVFVAKFNANGTKDVTFNSTGFFKYDLIHKVSSLDIAPDGKIVFYNKVYAPAGADIAIRIYLLQLNANGTLNTSFGLNGVFVNNYILNGYGPATTTQPIYADGTFADDTLGTLKIQPDGKTVIVEPITTNTNNNKDILVLRYDVNGNLDETFGNQGKIIYYYHNLNDYGSDFSIYNNKILIAGNAQDFMTQNNIDNRIALAKLNPDGTFDTSFNGTGKVDISLPFGDFDAIRSAALQADGKIIAAGTSFFNNKSYPSVLRYNPDGSLDTSFGINGSFLFTNSSISGEAGKTCIDSNGKIICNSYYPQRVIRLNSNGTLDTGFGSNGVASLASYIFSYDLQIDADDKIVVAGYYNSNFALARLNEDGSLDQAFGTNGVTSEGSSITDTNETILSLKILPDGKILAYGIAESQVILLRYNSNGTLDTSFGNSGKVLYGNSGSYTSISFEVTSQNIFILYGEHSANFPFFIVKLFLNGSPDTSFGSNGSIQTDLTYFTNLSSIKILPNGKILLGGRFTNNNSDPNDFALLLYNADGSIDNGFGNSGIVITDFDGGDDVSGLLLITNDGNALLTGIAQNQEDDYDYAMTKYYIDGNLNTENPNVENEVMFYPNPASDLVYVNEKLKTFEIYTVTGQKIVSFIENQTISLANLASGIYLAKSYLQDGTTVIKRLVKN